jgi:hypothetical protein
VEIGGWDEMCTWTNPPLGRLAAEVEGHAQFAIEQALAAPQIEIVHHDVVSLGDDTWRVAVGIANTGWLPTDISHRARTERLVRPLTAVIEGAEPIGSPARLKLGQLEGRAAARFAERNDGTPDRVLASWVVRGSGRVTVRAEHPRAGSTSVELPLA